MKMKMKMVASPRPWELAPLKPFPLRALVCHQSNYYQSTITVNTIVITVITIIIIIIIIIITIIIIVIILIIIIIIIIIKNKTQGGSTRERAT